MQIPPSNKPAAMRLRDALLEHPPEYGSELAESFWRGARGTGRDPGRGTLKGVAYRAGQEHARREAAAGRTIPRGAGVWERRRARRTGTHVVIAGPGVELAASEGWVTICQEHGGCVTHDTRALAEQWRSRPDLWCPTCMGEEAASCSR